MKFLLKETQSRLAVQSVVNQTVGIGRILILPILLTERIGYKMKKIIAIVLCALLAVPYCGAVLAADTTVNFTDVQADSAQGKAIYILAAAGIVNGNGDGTFAPDRGVTRAELCKMVNNIYGYTAEDETAFSDVTPDKWYYSHVKIAKKAGYITGFEDGTFRGDTPVTREQACAIVVRVAGIYDLGLPITIADAVSPWAEGYVKTIIANQLMQLEEGNRFRATEPMTRGELSIPLSNFVGSVGSNSAQTGGTSTGGVSIGGGSSSGGSSSGGSSSGGSSSGGSSSGGNTGSGNTGSEIDKDDTVIDSSGSTGSDNTGSDNSDSVENDTNKDTEYTVTIKGAGLDVTETKKDGSINCIPTYIFEGFYKNNFLNGKGKHLRYVNENLQLLVYEGDWLNGRPHGYGKKYDNGRLIYEGEWQNDKRHGHGKEYVNGQLQYEGDFQEDKRHGNGKLFQPDGTISYEGRFRNNNPIPATSN